MGSLFGHERRYQYEPALDLELVKILPKNTKRILDIGGGRGDKVLSVVSELGIEYSAVIDISEDAVRTKLENVDVALCANIEDRNVLEDFFQKHGPFDMVMCLDVLEHLVDPWKVIERLHYLLPEGGHIVSSIPNVQNYRGVIRVLTGTWGYKNTGLFDRTHLRYFGRRSSRELMTCTGLTLVGTSSRHSHLRMDKILDYGSLGLLARFVVLQYVYLVRKDTSVVSSPGFCGSELH